MSLEILLKSRNFIKKETLAQVFSCGFCEISKNTFYYKTPLVASSDSLEPFQFELKKRQSKTDKVTVSGASAVQKQSLADILQNRYQT